MRRVIRPVVIDGPIHRSFLSKQELSSHGLRHPAEQLWVTLKPVMMSLAVVAGALFVLWLFTGGTTLLLLVLATVALLSGVLINAVSSLVGARILLPDVFVGWPFSTESNEMFVASYRVLQISSCLWPNWGVVGVIPPSDPATDLREREGWRAAQYPFVLRATNDATWQSSVTWLIGQCRAAVFDTSCKATDSLAWEIQKAREILGADRVILLELDASGDPVFVVAGSALKAPMTLAAMGPPPPLRADFNALAALRAWAADALPVSKEDFEWRETWARIDFFLPHLSNLMLLAALALLLAALLVWI